MPDEIIVLGEQYYILATSQLTDDRTRVLKHNETFAVFDRFGDIRPIGPGVQGLYHRGTRFLSRLTLLIGDRRPALLSSTVKEGNAVLAADLSNPDVREAGAVVLPRGTVHLFGATFLWQGVCYRSLRLRNYGQTPLELRLGVRLEADFADVFEVRGQQRRRRGRRLADRVEDGGVVLAYEGLDGVERRTRVAAAPPPDTLTPGEMTFTARLAPREEQAITLTIACETGDDRPAPEACDAALAALSGALADLRAHDCAIVTGNAQFNDWVNRSAADLHLMVTQRAGVLFPYAGVPWFSCPFGRDAIITALEYLWVNPRIARGVLAFLGETQATEVAPAQDAQPGKILHEMREGEMAALGEHPFRRYYGSVDATPLYVILAGAYYERTADLELVREIWPAVERALRWIDEYGDVDGDGFVEYARKGRRGLVQQGWKDSPDSVFHDDGGLAEPPIALCEVQGYVYAARERAAALADALGHAVRAADLRRQARALQEHFEHAFWSEELGTYVIALDGEKRPCRVRTSNAGHCLWAGVASPARAAAVADELLGPAGFSGWGIRTVTAGEARYNPMSYHDGSVWPHDNALCAQGFARYGFKEHAARVFSGLFDAALFLDQRRLPELFCGFKRREGEGPTLYPVACAPQSWASGAAFLLLQALLGLELDAPARRLTLRRPLLPASLPEVELRGLRLGAASVDLALTRHRDSVGVNVLRREGELEIVTVK
ncbi:MAG TPA: glycogen debranching N-terminal domain-containing protein [Polyangia bacterium]|jgi:glycogen debranching enzyme